MIAGLGFAAPLALLALLALPLLWFLLRVTPPPPRRLPLPTLPLVADLLGSEREPRRTPWWLMLLRLAAAAALILALAGPRFEPDMHPAAAHEGSGPLILLLDDGWAAARDWQARLERAARLMNDRPERPVILLAAGEQRPVLSPEPIRQVMTRLQPLRPRPYFVDRQPAFDTAIALLSSHAGARLVWISDGITREGEKDSIAAFLARGGERLDIYAQNDTPTTALVGLAQNAQGVEALLRRAGTGAAGAPSLIRALDEKGRLLGEATATFAQDARETRARLALPLEIANDINRLEIAEANHAGAVHLVDGANRRRRVALISGETTDTAQPLVSARYFLARALAPYGDLREPPPGAKDPIRQALEDRPDVLVLADIGTIGGETGAHVARFVENGGVLIRFAGPGLAAAGDDLLPVRLRRGGRILGGALSWDKPRALGPFPEASPFATLAPAKDMRVERQVLAEPDSELVRASWAILEDGTPLVTGKMLGKGHLVLFHVTADTSWSNLPLSGLFVDMLRRVLTIAKGPAGTQAAGGASVTTKIAPRLTLDGFGQLGPASAEARPVDQRFSEPATRDHPPGFYGPPETGFAVNAVTPASAFEPISYAGHTPMPLANPRVIDFRPALMVAAVLLFLADALAMILIGGTLASLRRPAQSTAALLLGLALLAQIAPAARAEPLDLRSIRPEDIRSSLRPRLAYILTGDQKVDETSRAGLQGLGRMLSQRTSLHLDEPIGLDPARDELVFYSMIYWPVVLGQSRPSEQAIRAIDSFMKQGGTVLFDTRDAFIQRPGGQPTAETRALRAMLSALDLPALEPVPSDHVLTKTFYLLERFVGRYAAGDTWVETLAGASDAKVPARAGDRVSPIIITSNDLASAWALDRLGNPLYPLVPGEPRQREMAFRTGVNIVMYVMTGNYKADQVHVPALLERLGQ
ncbi:MAG: DUF4159 domain-containing protein [Proteobacteria bacterium]|nr:DUF4159 domain-containing protein [Pseudomonadota bacterium]